MSTIADRKKLSEDEKLLFELIEKGNADAAADLIKSRKVRVNCLDGNGMNPLDMACFKGDEVLAKLLIDSGADVNNRAHEQGYTCLMFAALSEKPGLCQTLLEAGCKSYAENNIGKTASEMAAFVGHYECVSVISSFISLADIDKIIHPNGANSEKIYPPELATFAHKLVKNHEIHPVRLVFKIIDEATALQYREKLLFTIDRIFEKQLRSKEPNEVMSVKLWIVLFTIRELLKYVDKQSKELSSTTSDDEQLSAIIPKACRLYAKQLLQMTPGDSVQPAIDKHIRSAICSFPYKQSLLHQTLMKAFKFEAGGEAGHSQAPSTFLILCESLFGPRYAKTSQFCWTCGSASSKKRCAKCKMAYYDAKDDPWDLEQEIARSAFADMLHDEDRNRRYKIAIEEAIRRKHQRGERAHVVDIGTGPGLLTLMAAEAGAEKVTTLEVFTPVAEAAKSAFRNHHDYSQRIELIHSRSTDIGQTNLSELGNILVAEVFDTELIGEGALRTFKEAHGQLVKQCSRTIPSRARIWIVPAESEELIKFHAVPSRRLMSPFGVCAGAASVFDVQLSQLTPGIDFRLLSAPFVAFEFNFENPTSYDYDGVAEHDVVISSDSKFNLLFMWWELDMSEGNVISLAPTWIEEGSPLKWRDHWMQSVYFLPEPVRVYDERRSVRVFCHHDEFSLWFNTQAIDMNLSQSIVEDRGCKDPERVERPICTCQLHTICSRSAFYRMNSLEENEEELIRYLNDSCGGKRVSCIGEASMLGLYIANESKHARVTLVESSREFRHVLHHYANHNRSSLPDSLEIVASLDEMASDTPFEVVLSELFFLTSALEVDSILRFASQVEELRRRSDDIDSAILVYPQSAAMKVMAVRFDHLWKIQAPISNVEGFDLSAFGKLYEEAKESVDSKVEAHPLWEYTSMCVKPAVEILHVDFRERFTGVDFTTTIEWHSLSTGLLNNACLAGDQPTWNRGYRQAVHFLKMNPAPPDHGLKIRVTGKQNDEAFTFDFE